MSINLLYMNQGGGGNWKGLDYAAYDILCLAESTVLKEHFIENYNSKTKPPMSVQTKVDGGRMVTEVKDIDVTALEVRPIVCFQLVKLAPMRVVFFHFKSGNENYATKALDTGVMQYLKIVNDDRRVPTLWIGDYNRATLDPLTAVFKDVRVLFKGGGISQWNLDRAVITGDWGGMNPVAKEASRSGDNQHVGISVVLG